MQYPTNELIDRKGFHVETLHWFAVCIVSRQ